MGCAIIAGLKFIGFNAGLRFIGFGTKAGLKFAGYCG